MSFIKSHLVENIKKQIEEKQNSVNFIGFFYFDDVITFKYWNINRINNISVYPKEKKYPLTFWSLNGETLLNIYKNLKSNKFFFYKKINGKSHKVRLKINDNDNNK